ncbi:MAG: hypothetical protein HOV83_32565 [Catenulispora sp.]|nr:hypothetical protein [Catenulispora sp.]
MENITTVAYGVQAYNPAPLFRVVGGAVVSSYRPVTGQQCCGFGGAVSQVDSVSGLELAGAAAVLGLRAYGPAQAERVRRTEQVQLVQQAERAQLWPAGDPQPGALLAQVHLSDGTTTGISGDNGSENGTNGSKPMTPWGYRTSSPPG